MDERSIDIERSDEIMLPGFRFHPTDEELVSFYLKRKIQQRPLSIELIKQLDIYKYDPWDLPKLASTGEKEWYFFCPRDRKYRNSARPNRVTRAGFWKATGTDRPIYSSEGTNKCIGLKKSLVFYKGRAAKGVKTDWMMHEFRLPSLTDHPAPPITKRSLDKSFPANDSWAICRIFKKPNSTAQRALSRSWVSPLPEPIPFHPQSSSSPENISTSASTKTASSPAISLCSSNIGLLPSIQTCFPYTNLTATLEQPPGGGQNINHRYSSNVDISSLLLNMTSSSETADFGGSSQEEQLQQQQTLAACYYNYLVNNNNNNNTNFQLGIEENNVGNDHEIKNSSNQWEMARSLGLAFGFAMNNNHNNGGDAWRTINNSVLEDSSLTQYSTSYYSTARC